MNFNIKPSKVVFYALLALAVLFLIVPFLQYTSYTARYNQVTSKSSNTIFEQAVLSTLNQEMSLLWTEQSVYDFTQSLARFTFTYVRVGNKTDESVYLPSGKTFKTQTITVNLGGILTLNDLVSLINSVESENKVVYIDPVHMNNLRDYKEISIKFYLGTDVPKPANRPLTYQYKQYGLVEMIKNPDDAKSINAVKVPVFFGNTLWLGIFDESKRASITLFGR